MRTKMNMECINILIATKHESCMHQLQEALNRGWAEWAKQAAELHKYRANRQKDGKGFYKLNEESIATICENLMQEYQALADRHSKEIA